MCAAPFIAAARNSPGFPDFYEHERAGFAAAKGRDVMRTIAATFSTRDEAEAASRRLEAIGLSRERIILKDVAAAGEGLGETDTGGGVFVSAKVTSEQVEAASEILKTRRMAEPAAVVAASPPPEMPVQSRPEPAPPAFGAARRDADPAPPTARRAIDERSKLGRYFAYYGLALVAAFIIGAWLGMLS
jgi:hypothetical protein